MSRVTDQIGEITVTEAQDRDLPTDAHHMIEGKAIIATAYDRATAQRIARALLSVKDADQCEECDGEATTMSEDGVGLCDKHRPPASGNCDGCWHNIDRRGDCEGVKPCEKYTSKAIEYAEPDADQDILPTAADVRGIMKASPERNEDAKT